MHSCPHCQQKSISGFPRTFKELASRKLRCGSCGTVVKAKAKLSNFYVFIFLGSVLFFRLAHVDFNVVMGAVVCMMAIYFQLHMAEFEVVESPKGSL